MGYADGAKVTFANEPIRPSQFSQLVSVPENHIQEFIYVPGSTVAWANYAAIRRDFPQIRESQMSDAQIDDWIVSNFAYLNRNQLLLQDIRVGPIPQSDRPSKRFLVPPGYGRACVAEAHIGNHLLGLIDLKGTGITSPSAATEQRAAFARAQGNPSEINELRIRHHSDGMMTLGEGTAELTRGLALQRSMDIYNATHDTNYQTAENYFEIALPVEILRSGSTRLPASIVGRQAHWRGTNLTHVPNSIYQDFHGFRQGTRFGSAVDFGGVIVQDPNLQANFGPLPGTDPTNPQTGRPWAGGHDAARNYTQGNPTAIREHIRTMLEPGRIAWERASSRDTPYTRFQSELLILQTDQERFDALVRFCESNSNQENRAALRHLLYNALQFFPASVSNAVAPRELNPHFFPVYEGVRDAWKAGEVQLRGSQLEHALRLLDWPRAGPRRMGSAALRQLTDLTPEHRHRIAQALGDRDQVVSQDALDALERLPPFQDSSIQILLTRLLANSDRRVIARRLLQRSMRQTPVADPQVQRLVASQLLARNLDFATAVEILSVPPTVPDGLVDDTIVTAFLERNWASPQEHRLLQSILESFQRRGLTNTNAMQRLKTFLTQWMNNLVLTRTPPPATPLDTLIAQFQAELTRRLLASETSASFPGECSLASKLIQIRRRP